MLGVAIKVVVFLLGLYIFLYSKKSYYKQEIVIGGELYTGKKAKELGLIFMIIGLSLLFGSLLITMLDYIL